VDHENAPHRLDWRFDTARTEAVLGFQRPDLLPREDEGLPARVRGVEDVIRWRDRGYVLMSHHDQLDDLVLEASRA
jgi:hypothetical protein